MDNTDYKNFNICFGHLAVGRSFYFEGHYYEKLGNFVLSNGDIINAVKLPPSEEFFDPTEIQDYYNSTFLYMDDTTVIDQEDYSYEPLMAPDYIPHQEFGVPAIFSYNKKMWHVFDTLFQHKTLSIEMQDVLRAYTHDYYNEWADKTSIPLSDIITEKDKLPKTEDIKEPKVEDTIQIEAYANISRLWDNIHGKTEHKEQQENDIMQQIEAEVAVYRQNLIKKRLGR